MKIIKVWNDDPSDRQITELTDLLKVGEIAIIPTDTLYAIACDALNQKAVERLCKIKGINPDKTNLSIICDDISMASEYARYDNYAFHLMRQYAPGPFTFLFKAAASLPKVFKRRKNVGVRIPSNNVCRDVVKKLGNPLLVTSIEYADEDYGRNPELIMEAYDRQVDIMVDGGEGGLMPSTIVDCRGSEAEVVREGLGKFEE